MTAVLNAVKSIRRSGARNMLTATGIAVGVFAVVLISSLGETGSQMIYSAMDSMGINSVMIQPDDESQNVRLGDEDIQTISSVYGVSKAMPLMSTWTDTVLIDTNVKCIVWGVDKNAKDIISLTPAYGRLISSADVQSAARVCVIDESIAERVYGRGNIVGKNVKIKLGGSYETFRVVGVARSGINALQSSFSGIIPDFVYIPYTAAQKLMGRSGYDSIAALIDSTDGETVSLNIESAIRRTRNEDGIVVANLLGQKEQLKGVLSTVKIVLSLIAGISLVISGITVMTSMLVSVSERTAEIGIKKAIGAKSSTICMEFLAESIVISVFGAVMGMVCGFLFTAVGCAAFGVSPSIDTGMVIISFAAAVVTGIAFGVYPSLKAARMPPAEAFRTGR